MQPLLHLVGILFPHINGDARSKSHHITCVVTFKGGDSVMQLLNYFNTCTVRLLLFCTMTNKYTIN